MLNVKPIRSEREYKAALDAITQRIDAHPGTPEADELEVLSILVEAWERVHEPIDPPDPIDAIAFRLDQA